MSYFDEEFIQQLAAENIPYRPLLPAEEKTLINAISNRFPFSSGRIRWDAIPGSVHFENDGDANLKALSALIESTRAANVILLGDSLTETAYSVKIGNVDTTLRLFSEIPQHNYVLPEDLNWIACMSMECYMDFGVATSSGSNLPSRHSDAVESTQASPDVKKSREHTGLFPAEAGPTNAQTSRTGFSRESLSGCSAKCAVLDQASSRLKPVLQSIAFSQ